MQLESFILTFPRLVDAETCQAVIDTYGACTEPALVEGNIEHPDRTCTQLHTSKKKSDIERLVSAYAKKASIQYRKQFPKLRISDDTGLLYVRYDEGQFYKQHVDEFPGKPRLVTISIALNDDYKGGEWAWFDRQITCRLRTGDAVMFPSNFMFPHEILPVTKGTRHAMITWFT